MHRHHSGAPSSGRAGAGPGTARSETTASTGSSETTTTGPGSCSAGPDAAAEATTATEAAAEATTAAADAAAVADPGEPTAGVDAGAGKPAAAVDTGAGDVPRTGRSGGSRWDVPRTGRDVPRPRWDVPRAGRDVPRPRWDVPRAGGAGRLGWARAVVAVAEGVVPDQSVRHLVHGVVLGSGERVVDVLRALVVAPAEVTLDRRIGDAEPGLEVGRIRLALAPAGLQSADAGVGARHAVRERLALGARPAGRVAVSEQLVEDVDRLVGVVALPAIGEVLPDLEQPGRQLLLDEVEGVLQRGQ